MTLIFGYFILGIKVDNSLETMTIDNDPELLLMQQMDKEYGGEEFVVIAFKGEDIFSPRILSMIDRMTRRIEDVKNVGRVLSLTNAYTIKGTSGGFGTTPLLPKTSIQPEELKEKVTANKIYKRWLFSDDGKSTSIIAWMVPLGSDDALRSEVVSEIQRIIDKEKDNRRFYLYGMSVIYKTVFDAMDRDQLHLTPIVFALVGLILFFIFRNLRFIIIPFIVITICVVWVVGLLVASGNTLNWVTSIIPIVVLIVCICDSIHIITQYKETIGEYPNNKDALKEAIIRIGIPILLTSVTTAVGFFSLGLNKIKPVRDFGIYTGMGVIFALTTSITLLPIILSFLKLKKEKSRDDKSFKAMESILTGIGKFIIRRKGLILTLSVVIVLLSLIGISRIEARQDSFDILKDSTELVEANKFIDVELGGSCEVDVLFDGKAENTVIEPISLKQIERIQHRLENEVPEILKANSVVDFLKEMNQAINGDDPDYYSLPSTKEQASQLLLLYSFDEDQANLQSLINNDYSQARIRTFTISADDSIATRKAINKMKQIISEELNTDLKIVFTGRPLIWCNMVDYLITGLMESFSIAFVVISIMMIVVFRSIGLGLLSMIINVIPVIITFGIMGFLNIPLNMTTVMVPSVAIGIAVDDTIHLMWRMVKEISIDGNYEGAMFRTLKSVGKPIITTSLILCVGFSGFYFSELRLLTQFGFITFVTVFVALIADLFLAPVLLLVIKPIKIKKGMPSIALLRKG
ncbi:MAG: efflux RND transporter permease subunit [Spirochaetota bacterium]|nr:efflux RND transporter permease subunit [Spirochaetota bacterium]